LQEANDLVTVLRGPGVTEPMVAVGMSPDAPTQLETAADAARAAESQWTVARDRSKSDAQRDREARGVALRSELLATARWALRDDRIGMATVGAISEGEGVADLVQDLHDTGELIERKPEAFAADTTFDARAAVEEARSLAAEISAGTSNERIDTTQAATKDLRDRAFTHLTGLVSEIREAGRYAHRKNAALAKRFASRYERARRTRARRPAAPSAPAPGGAPQS
jgi:hypothetical protein